MSKLKTPREKKLASLALDGRNVYGENDKSSRKAIPRGKRRGHKAVRLAVSEALRAIHFAMSEDQIVALEANARSRAEAKKRGAFRKRADAPLADVLAYKSTGDGKLLWRHRF